jgi:uncharacterized membrane protein (DUF4010 family)
MQAKDGLQRLSRDLISEQEMRDALTLAAAALVVMPVLPEEPVDPWGALKLTTLWRIVVLVMAVGMLGHVARRFLGPQWGISVTGFFSGFASSTAATASFGHRAKSDPRLAIPAASAALLSNLASLSLLAAVIATASLPLFKQLAVPLAVAGGCLLAAAPFKLSHALLVAVVIAVVSVLAAWLQRRYGAGGALLAAVIAGLGDLQAAAVSLAQLSARGAMNATVAQWGVIAVLASSSLAKICLAYVSGGWKYCAYVGAGLLAMLAGGAGTLLWFARQA